MRTYCYLILTMILGSFLGSVSVYAGNVSETAECGISTGQTTIECGISAEQVTTEYAVSTEQIKTENTTAMEQTTTQQEKKEQTTNCILTKGMQDTYYLKMNGNVKWSVSNKKIVKLVKKSNKKCVIKGLKNGNAVITAKTDSQTLKIKVSVKSGSAFTNAWCKNWVKTNITENMTPYEKVLRASYYMNVGYTYGSTYDVRDVIVKKRGTCVSGGRLLVQLLKKMGFQAQLRFAAKDNMSRYPKGVYFASQHYNVKVKINKKYYYVDGTPGTGFIYLSSETKPLYCAVIVDGKLKPLLNEIE